MGVWSGHMAGMEWGYGKVQRWGVEVVGSSGPRSWAFLPEKMPFRVPVGCRTPLPHHTAEASLDESRCQAVHPNVALGQLYGQVLGEAQQGCFTNIVRAQALGKGENGLFSSIPVHSWFLT